ncbi:MAG: hypothetical protein AB7O66_10490 [Limisphaerales bacterium]
MKKRLDANSGRFLAPLDKWAVNHSGPLTIHDERVPAAMIKKPAGKVSN